MNVRQRLEACERRWGLRRPRRLAGGRRAAVFECDRPGGNAVVVKLAVTRSELHAEAAALATWRGAGATVTLLETDDVVNALLLERVWPGTPLPAGDAAATIEAAANLLGRLHEAAPWYGGLPLLEEVYPGLERRAREDAAYEQYSRGEPDRGGAGVAWLADARRVMRSLCATTAQRVLLHGDFLDKNVLLRRNGYVACDPLPRVGDPCADVGFFAAGHPPAAGVLRRARRMATLMGLDPDRAQRWAAIWAVHQHAQAWREDQGALDALLAAVEFRRLLDVR